MYKSLQEVLQATLKLANTSMPKRLREVQYIKKAFTIQFILICMGMCNVHRLMYDWDSTWMSQVSGLRKELLPSLPYPRPSPPSPLGSHLLLVSWCLGVNWPRRLWGNPPMSLGNWSHPLPLVSAWLAVDYSQRAAATLSSLDQLSAAWWSATGCALLSIQPTKIVQKLTVSLDFRSTAGWMAKNPTDLGPCILGTFPAGQGWEFVRHVKQTCLTKPKEWRVQCSIFCQWL